MIPIHKKARNASTAAAAATGLILYFLGHYVLGSPVPDVVSSWIYTLLPAALTFAAAHLATRGAPPPAPAPVLNMAQVVAQVRQALAAQGLAPIPGQAGNVGPAASAQVPAPATTATPAPPPQPAAPA